MRGRTCELFAKTMLVGLALARVATSIWPDRRRGVLLGACLFSRGFRKRHSPSATNVKEEQRRGSLIHRLLAREKGAQARSNHICGASSRDVRRKSQQGGKTDALEHVRQDCEGETVFTGTRPA